MKKITTRLLSILVITTVAYLFFKTLTDNWDNIGGLSAVPDSRTFIGMFLLILSVVSTGMLWGQLVKRLSGKEVGHRAAVKTHLASWLLKYIPGQAGSYLGKINWGTKNGISKIQITNSFIYENIFLILASTVPTVPVILWLFADELDGDLGIFLPLLIVLPLVVLLNGKVFFTIANRVAKFFKKTKIGADMFLSGGELWAYQLKFIVPRILNGLGFVFIAASFFEVTPGMVVPLACIYVLAGIIGVLAVFVPSGLGVREGVIVLLSSAYFTNEEAVALALLARFYATIADIGIFGLYTYLNKGRVSLT